MSTITTINASDNISDSRGVINTNFGNLNSDKLEASDVADKITNPMTTAGDVIYGGTAGAPTRLGVGTAAQVLKVNATEDGVEWGDVSGTGDVIGPASNTDGNIPQWDGADSKTLKDGLAVVTTLGSPGADTNIPTEAAVRAAITGAGGGDVTGPGSSTDGNIAVFSGITGKIIADGTTAVSSLVPKSLFDANTIIAANSDNTPAAVTIAEQKILGRATGGNITALDIDSDLSSVSANDDTVPSAKATKAMGDLKLALAGGTMSGDITLGENTSVALDPSLSADGKYTGLTITGTAGTTLAFGDLITLDKDDSRWELVDISVAAAATGDARGILGMALNSASDGDSVKILLWGNIRADANFPTLTIGAPVYASTTGDVVVTQPTTTDYVIRVIGFALTADSLHFCPSCDYITHT